MSTPVSVISELGHSLSHVYNQNTSVRHDWILALTVDIHSRSHQTASNIEADGWILEQHFMFVLVGTVFHHSMHPRNSWHSKVLHHLGSKAESCVYRSLKVQVNYEVAPVVRPILSVHLLTGKGVLVVFGENSSFIQLPDGHKIPTIRENGSMVLNATLVDRRDMTWDLVSPVVPTIASSN